MAQTQEDMAELKTERWESMLNIETWSKSRRRVCISCLRGSRDQGKLYQTWCLLQGKNKVVIEGQQETWIRQRSGKASPVHEGINREIWQQQGRMSVEEKLVPESVSYFLKEPVKY